MTSLADAAFLPETGHPEGGDDPDPAEARYGLRILATSDLHMQLLAYDYLTLSGAGAGGLARAASLIRRRQAEVPASLLLDNGDFLQGTPVGDHAATCGQARCATGHPAIAAMNALGYDAAALGNHDFNFGLRFLRRTVAAADFPVLAANLSVRHGAGFAPYTILTRRLCDGRGGQREVRIGVVGFLPPQTAEWDRDLTPEIACEDILDSARRVLPQMRAAGAELVIALAHSGIGDLAGQPRMEHAATALAALPGIDVVIAGHTHQVFPHPDFPVSAGVDPLAGRLAGKPAAMPGVGGSHLAVIDLALSVAGGRLTIASAQVRCEPVAADLPELPEVARPVAPAHKATLRHLKARVGRSSGPIDSHFSIIGQDAGLRLVAQAQRWHVRRQLRGTRWQDLPILSAAAPFRSGGRAGPGNYTRIPPGSLQLRHMADLYAFPNRIAAVCLSGAQLRDWLERSASMFRQLPPGSRDVPLLDPAFPAYNFDIVDTVSWQIDLSCPPRFTPAGALTDPAAGRVRGLCHRGRPVAPEDRFILATNTYRLASCGLFAPLVAENEIALAGGPLTRDILRRYVRRRRRIAPDHRLHWQFLAPPGSTALFPTSPAATGALPLPGMALEPAGETEDGFALMRLTF